MMKGTLQWIVMAVFSVLIILLILQNLSIRDSYAKLSGGMKGHPGSRPAPMVQNHLKASFLFKKFPLRVIPSDFHFPPEQPQDFCNGYIIMVFDLTVCGKCLHQQLNLLKSFREKAAEKNLSFLALIGVTSDNEKTEIINLYRTGQIFFPCEFIGVRTLYETFRLEGDRFRDRFLDTPFYVYTSHDFRVLDVFKPRYLETRGFDQWLTVVTGQDIF